ncbi:MAG: helix-turn-helix transcriptional regulator [Bdellovibrionaceae bacterium]|nr:helix-turn-helix transcriptional regulator [Pseudobdellovibrionaceae bacterium]
MNTMLGKTLKPARLRLGWSLDELAKAAGGVVSKQMLSKYEQGLSCPSQEILFAVAAALGTKAGDLLTEPKSKVEFVAFRKHSKLSASDQEKVKARVCWQMEGRLALSSTLGESTPRWQGQRMTAHSIEDAERHAVELRAEWGLGRQPIASLTSLLEDKGAAVLQLKEEEEFSRDFGLG